MIWVNVITCMMWEETKLVSYIKRSNCCGPLAENVKWILNSTCPFDILVLPHSARGLVQQLLLSMTDYCAEIHKVI